MCFIRAYLRASTDEQDAARARGQVEAFAAGRGMQIAAWYVENESGAKLDRPELFRLLADAHKGDVLLIENVDRLSRLDAAGWEALKVQLADRKVRVVALDLPTSWIMASTSNLDDFTARMFDAINGMLLDMLAAIARKDYEDRRRRQMQGQEKAKAAGKYVGRPENKRRNARIAAMLAAGTSYSDVQNATGCSRATVAKIAKRRTQAA
jgi:DNA invertase Pin-like site-specific DNA recombinase